jgi:hypothetical protein
LKGELFRLLTDEISVPTRDQGGQVQTLNNEDLLEPVLSPMTNRQSSKVHGYVDFVNQLGWTFVIMMTTTIKNKDYLFHIGFLFGYTVRTSRSEKFILV